MPTTVLFEQNFTVTTRLYDRPPEPDDDDGDEDDDNPIPIELPPVARGDSEVGPYETDPDMPDSSEEYEEEEDEEDLIIRGENGEDPEEDVIDWEEVFHGDDMDTCEEGAEEEDEEEEDGEEDEPVDDAGNTQADYDEDADWAQHCKDVGEYPF